MPIIALDNIPITSFIFSGFPFEKIRTKPEYIIINKNIIPKLPIKIFIMFTAIGEREFTIFGLGSFKPRFPETSKGSNGLGGLVAAFATLISFKKILSNIIN